MSEQIHFDENCHNARWLGYFDLLGTRQLINTGNYIGTFCVYARAVNEAKRRTKKWAEIRHACFSDTFLIYSDDDSASDFAAMDMVARWFVHFLIMNRIPVRGAVACGDFYADSEHSPYFGKALVEAYEYGEAQDRLGYLLCPSAMARLEVLDLSADARLNYAYSDVPFHEGKEPENAVKQLPGCLLGRWVMINGENQCLSRLREMMGESKDARIVRKYKNTIEFVENNSGHLVNRDTAK